MTVLLPGFERLTREASALAEVKEPVVRFEAPPGNQDLVENGDDDDDAEGQS